MTDSQNISFLTATELLSKTAKNQLNFEAIASAQDSRIKAINPGINAFDSLSNSINQGRDGLLRGLPISVKDQIHVADMPCNFGLDKAQPNLCVTTASPIQRLLDAGVTIIGKTNLPPYAMDFQTFNKRVGRTSNPWNKEYTTGGSSGGGAAAVAAGMSYLDIGADLAGSLRIPAAFCGVFSLLPSEGSLESEGMMLKSGSLPHFARMGPITRSVDDLMLAWRVLSGVESAGSKASVIKLAFWDTEDHHVIDKRILDMFKRTRKIFLSQGVELQDTQVDSILNDTTYQCYGEIMGYETGALLAPLVRILGRLLGRSSAKRSPNFLTHVHSGQAQNRSRYADALKLRGEIQKDFDAAYADVDAVLLPVTRVATFKHKTPSSDRQGIRDYKDGFCIAGQRISYLDAITDYTTPISLIGNPVVTLPLGLDDRGLPVGAQLVGKRGKEWQLLHLANKLSSYLPSVSLS